MFAIYWDMVEWIQLIKSYKVVVRLRYLLSNHAFVLNAVLTTARCCLAATPGVSVDGIAVTIGATQVDSTFILQGPRAPHNNRNDGTYYEFITPESGQIFTPPEYHQYAAFGPANNHIWDVCLIKLGQEHRVPGEEIYSWTLPRMGEASVWYCGFKKV